VSERPPHFLQIAADYAADGVGADSVGGVGDPFADALLGWLLAGRGGQAHPGQQRFVGDAVEGNAEGCAAPGCQRGLKFDQRAIDPAGEGSEEPVDALHRDFALGVGKAAASNLFGEDDRGRRLALDPRGEDLFGDQFDGGSGQSADDAGEEAFGQRAGTVCFAHGGLRCAGNHNRPNRLA
jgi:hypothetical protein